MTLVQDIDDVVQRHLTEHEAGISVIDKIDLLAEAQRLRIEIIDLVTTLEDVLGEL